MNCTTRTTVLCLLAALGVTGCATDPDLETGQAAALTQDVPAHIAINVDSGEMLEVRSLEARDRFAVTALIEKGDTTGTNAFLVVETECLVQQSRLVCAELGWAPIVETRNENDSQVAVVALADATMTVNGSLSWLWAFEDEDTGLGVSDGDPCFSSGGSGARMPAGQTCKDVEDLPGQVCCDQTCVFTCVGGSATSAGEFVSSDCQTDEATCAYVPSASTTPPGVQPAF